MFHQTIFDSARFFVFLSAAILLAIAPGPGMLYVLARSLGGGRREGLVSALGTFFGGMVHVSPRVRAFLSFWQSRPWLSQRSNISAQPIFAFLGFACFSTPEKMMAFRSQTSLADEILSGRAL